jgi:VIT1/CCC1 family predicted Fe2+/Mn2+ transporter
MLRASILGGVDGAITSFAIVAGASFTEDARSTVAVVGFSSLVADGFSMGVAEYLSSAAEQRLRPTVNPALLGIACFSTFVVCGAFPLLIFLATERILSCAAFFLVELMLLGTGQSHSTDEWILTGLTRTATLGGAAGLVAYGVGKVASLA